MKIFAIITVTSCLVGFAFGGGDSIKDFEYVDDVAIGIDGRVNTEIPEFASGSFDMTIDDIATPGEPLNRQLPIRPNFFHDNFLLPIKPTLRSTSKPPVCIWGFFGRLANPTNKDGNCNLICGLFERKIKYRVGKKFLFFGGRDVCCCVRD